MFTRGEVIYARPTLDGRLGHLPDGEIEAMLNDLAIELGAALGRVGL